MMQHTVCDDSVLLKQGWIAIKGRLPVLRNMGVVNFTAQSRYQTLNFTLHLSKTGSFFELVYLPADMSQLSLDILQDSLKDDAIVVKLRRVFWPERLYLMTKRVWPVFKNIHRFRRYRAGLYWYTPLLSINKAYQVASWFRNHSPNIDYDEWLGDFDEVTPEEARSIIAYSAQLRSKAPKVIVLVDAREYGVFQLEDALKSLTRQLYRQFETLVLVADENQKDQLSKRLTGDRFITEEGLLTELKQQPSSTLVLWLGKGAYLSQHALTWFIDSAIRQADFSMVYSDHDVLNEQGERVNPQFKPDWSSTFAKVSAYPSNVLLFPLAQVIDYLQGEHYTRLSSYALMLSAGCLSKTPSVVHIPSVLWSHNEAYLTSFDAHVEKPALEKTLLLEKIDARVSIMESGFFRLHYELVQADVQVSIIIPTRNMLHLLKPCVESVLAKTERVSYEIIIVDNNSDEADALAFMSDCQQRYENVKVVHYADAFNFSAINNFAASFAKGEYLCLLNNDTEVITSGWLFEMLSIMQAEPDVGAVGARLLYSDNHLQHAGDLIGGGGCADHLHGAIAYDDPGYMHRAVLPQDLSAVTAACVLTPKSVFETLKGLDADNLCVAFNDVDYCLRVREAGLRVLFTPYAELYHHESVSRGIDKSLKQRRRGKREANYMRKRWKDIIGNDPFYNPNLNYVRSDFSLNANPRVKRPWE